MAKILIIDDDLDMCSTLSDMVGSEGNEVGCAHDLKTGFSKVSSGFFDVVFLDVMMPDGNGLFLLPEIRKNSLQTRGDHHHGGRGPGWARACH